MKYTQDYCIQQSRKKKTIDATGHKLAHGLTTDTAVWHSYDLNGENQ